MSPDEIKHRILELVEYQIPSIFKRKDLTEEQKLNDVRIVTKRISRLNSLLERTSSSGGEQ